MIKDAYIPDLNSLQMLGELNYRRIARIMRSKEADEQWHFLIHSLGGQESRLSLVLTQQSQYTSQLQLTFGQQKKSELLFDHSVSMIVRLYHDVKIAEITDGHRQYQGTYPYPNDAMLHKDEKMRLNQQLADLLELCLKHGYRLNQESLLAFA